MVFQAYGRAVSEPPERLQRLEQARQATVTAWRLHPVVEALQALRGVQCTVAGTTVAELGDLTRCEPPRPRMNFLGRPPAEYSTGERRRQGAITKAGNTQARRALVEGAGAYRSPAKVRRHLPLRLEKQAKAIQASGWKAQVRLCKCDRRLMARGKNANQVVVAIARELIGFMWAIAQQVPVTASGQKANGPSTPNSAGFHRALEEPQPRWGATLDGVQRPLGILGSRVRQAPDGGKSGGPNPRIAAGSTVVSYWLRRF
jgi:hypothetical protein